MTCLRLIGRLVALFIIFVFVAVTPPLLLAYDAQQVAMGGNFLDELFEDSDLFEEAIPEIAQDLARNIPDDYKTRRMPIAQLDADDWERILYAITPPSSMQRWSQDAVKGFRRWVRRGGPFMDDVILPFGEVRDNMVNDPDQTVLRALTQAQPECSGGQEPLGGSDNLIPQCRPPAEGLEAFYQRLAGRWHEQPREVWRQLWPEDVARYPDDISLTDFVEEESGEEWWDTRANWRASWRASRWGLRAARWLLTAFIAAQCAVALGLVALFAARNWREALRWIGSPLVLAGAFTLLLAFLIFVGAEIGTPFISDQGVPIGMQEVIEDTTRAFADEMWPPMAWQGGVLALIGLGMWTLSFFAPVGRELAYAPVAPAPSPAPSSPALVSEPIADTAPAATSSVAPEESQLTAPEEALTPETGASEEAATPEETAPVETGEEGQEPPGDTA